MTKLSQRSWFDRQLFLGRLPAGDARKLTSPARFDGHIYGWGTESGLRFVVGDWSASPYGAFTDVMMAHQDGRRELLAPTQEVADLVSSTYHFDAVTTVPIEFTKNGRERVLHAGDLHARFALGPRMLWGYPLNAIPDRLTSPHLARFMGPFASLLMPGVRTHGTAGGGKHEYYVAHDLHRLEALDARWADRDLGRGTRVEPVVSFGFSSTPRTPCCTRVTTFIEAAYRR